MDKFFKKEIVPLKEVFGVETQFSKWLSEDGIEYLKRALGIELISNGREVKPNNKFSTDILMSVNPQYIDGDQPKVVIENQYGRTDHEHFSKLITYAVANNAKYAVWIAEDIHPEHKNAINWLNDNTNENINIYVFKAVIEKIGSSQSFLLLPVCEPKDEFKISMSKKSKSSKLNTIQLKFWNCIKENIDSGQYLFNSTKAQPQHWYNIYIGSSKCHISICMISKTKRCRLELWIDNNKELYDSLFSKKEEIEHAVGRRMCWDKKEKTRNGKPTKASSISYEIDKEIDILNEIDYKKDVEIILNELQNHFIKITKFI